MKYKGYMLIAIVILAAILRLWQIGNIPPSPDWDEVSLGYNAYSIMQTGRDEYGEFLPIVLRSFDDYKPALYAYLIIPFIKLFGLNIITVRLPSVIFGILTVVATYFLVKEPFLSYLAHHLSHVENDARQSTPRSKRIPPFSLSESRPPEFQGSSKVISGSAFNSFSSEKAVRLIALLSAGLLAISPWHIQFSRIAFEANVGLALNIFVFLFFLKGLKNPKFLIVSFMLGALNVHMYQSNRVFTPLLLLALSIIYIRQMVKIKWWYAVSVLIATLITLPLFVYIVTSKDALLRAKGVSVFSEQTQLLQRSAQKLVYDRETGNTLGLILDNRRIEFAKSIISGYISHFDLNWLFITGDIARHHAPNMGLLYLFELPFLFIGIYKLAFAELDKKIKFAIFSYFFLVPIPASITTGVPHAVRTLNFLPMFQIFTAIGLVTTFSFINRYKVLSIKYYVLKAIPYTFFFIFVTLNFVYYLNQYFVQQNYFNSKEWQYGYRDAVDYVTPIMSRYQKIVVSNKPPLDQSYMFFLFYLKYNPAIYQQEAKYASGGFAENHEYGKFEFRPIEWEREEKTSSILYIGKPQDFPDDTSSLRTVLYLDGEPSIKIVEPI